MCYDLASKLYDNERYYIIVGRIIGYFSYNYMDSVDLITGKYTTTAKESLKTSEIIECGRLVLEREIEGIRSLFEVLDDTFTNLVELLYNSNGRVILSGMGKSGHIANKISATLASTGTPSFFVHPGEASHGDLGMVTKDDVVILLSNSGETVELRDFINYTRRFNIPLVGIVRRKRSTLVSSADIAIVLPEIPEASPIGAPTTSTTMMLALGDAIAVALLNKKGFKEEDFGNFHPGGKLGQAFVKVKDLMHTGDTIPLVRSDLKMSDALIEMTSKSLGCAGVTDNEGKIIGIITDGDLRRHINSGIMNMKAYEVMTANPVTVSSECLSAKALAIMEDKAITTLFILDQNQRPQGIIHIHDILRAGIA